MKKETTVDIFDNKNSKETSNVISSESKKGSEMGIHLNHENITGDNENFILIDLSKKGNTAEILSSVENLKKEKDMQQIKLNLKSNSGYLPNAMEIAQAIHFSENVDLHIKVNGSIGVAETVLAAAGQIGFRSAEYGSTFTLGKHGKYPKDSNIKSLTPEDKRTYELIGKFTGKASLIGKFLLSGGVIGTKEAKQANIIDVFSEFKSKYLPEKTKSNRGRKSKSEKISEIELASEVESDTTSGNIKAENVLETKEIS